jgi:predicted ATP-grasp superfamily ATP-dependent carboligase
MHQLVWCSYQSLLEFVTNQTKVQSIHISFVIIKIFKEIDQVQVNYLPNVLIVKKGETIRPRSPLSIYDPNTDSLLSSS